MLKNVHGSPNHSISGDDDIVSDHEDPIHSESLLNELFYKHSAIPGESCDVSGDEAASKRHKTLDDEANMVCSKMTLYGELCLLDTNGRRILFVLKHHGQSLQYSNT